MSFGDAIEKLGEYRNCKSISMPDDVYGNKNEPSASRLAKDYGAIEEIPIHDVEYIFHNIADRYLMTSINIFLYKSNDDFSKDFNIATPSKSEEPKSLVSAPKITYVIQRKCNNAALKFTDVWGGAEVDQTTPKWIDTNNNVEASLVGVACNILNMRSIDMLNGSGVILKEESNVRLQG